MYRNRIRNSRMMQIITHRNTQNMASMLWLRNVWGTRQKICQSLRSNGTKVTQ